MANKNTKIIEAVDLQGVDVLEEGIVPAYASIQCEPTGGPDTPTEPPTDTLPG